MDCTYLSNLKTDIEKQLIETDSENKQNMLLDVISSQRLYYFKNKTSLVFDSYTGCLFPNKVNLADTFKEFKSGSVGPDFINTVQQCIEVDGYSNFRLPSEENYRLYFTPALNVFNGKFVLSLNSNTDKDGDIINFFNKNGVYSTRGHIVPSGEFAVAVPFCIDFISEDFSPEAKGSTPKKRAEKIIKLFIQEGWIPKIDDEEITNLYEKTFVTRPALIKQLADINEALAAIPAPKIGFADGINFEELFKEYDLAVIRNSHVQYYAETIRWFDSLLTNLDAFICEHADLLSEAQTLSNRLTVAHHDDEYPVLTERAEYLASHLDFGVETLQSKLIAFKNEAVAGRDRLADAQDFASLREIEKLERPDFYLIAEHTAGMVKRQLVGVDWFREHKELATTLIDLHEAWRKDFHEFEHTTREHFIQKCQDKSIEELADDWFEEWRKERLLLEEHLLPLMKAGIEKVIPVEVVIDAVEVLRANIRDQLAKFFFDKRFALHFKMVLEPRGELQERLLKDAEMAKINAQFQKALEELVFTIASSEGRLFLFRWAKDWYDVLIGEVLAFIELDSLQEQIARNTLDEFRAMKLRNLGTFQADARSNAEARDQKFEQLNELIGRIHADLKKNGKGNE